MIYDLAREETAALSLFSRSQTCALVLSTFILLLFSPFFPIRIALQICLPSKSGKHDEFFARSKFVPRMFGLQQSLHKSKPHHSECDHTFSFASLYVFVDKLAKAYLALGKHFLDKA